MPIGSNLRKQRDLDQDLKLLPQLKPVSKLVLNRSWTLANFHLLLTNTFFL